MSLEAAAIWEGLTGAGRPILKVTHSKVIHKLVLAVGQRPVFLPWISPGLSGVLTAQQLVSLKASGVRGVSHPQCLLRPHFGNHALSFPQYLTAYMSSPIGRKCAGSHRGRLTTTESV